ncbi:MAG: 23S rRNA (pseudouridine(1915)-N(3))-methyltransferase RlmH [Bacteroidota bacterium]|jgi:23S rRNA (pseudouridine1915-N3)-methyltransferase
MKIKLIQIGKTHFSFVQDGVTLFESRLKHYCKFEQVVLELPAKYRSAEPSVVKKMEGELLLKQFQHTEYVFLLDEEGQSYNSRKFAALIEKTQLHHASISFVIGGAFGFSDEVYARANNKLSLSAMTFSHQLIRLIFLEQLYRAFTIIRGEPYHND